MGREVYVFGVMGVMAIFWGDTGDTETYDTSKNLRDWALRIIKGMR